MSTAHSNTLAPAGTAIWWDGGERAITGRAKEVTPKTVLDHQIYRVSGLLNRPCGFFQLLHQTLDDLALGAPVELPSQLLVVLDQRIPVAHLNTQSRQKHQEPLDLFAWLDGVYRWRKPKCLPIRARQPFIRTSSMIEQGQPVIRTVSEVPQRDLKVENREASAHLFLLYARPVRQQDGKKSSNGGRPSAGSSDGIPRYNTALSAKLFASKNSLHPNHFLTSLPTCPHSGTGQAMRAEPVTLANVKPPRDLRTKVPAVAEIPEAGR